MITLSKLRLDQGFTQQQLSEKSHVTISTLQKLESGTNDIHKAQVDTVLKLARALGVTIEELVKEN